MEKKRKRGWHFKKSFLVFCAAVTAVLVAVIIAVAVHFAKKDNQTDLPQLNVAATENATAAAANKKDKKGKKDKKDKDGKSPQSTAPDTSAPINPTVSVPPTTDPNEKVIYLTFDDGPSKNTGRILDTLEQYGVKATFFVIHTYDGCEAQIKQIYDKGHSIGLHSYTHDFAIYQSEQTYFDDLNKISDLVYNATGIRSKLVRFPGGTSNTVSRSYSDGIMTLLSQKLPENGYRYFDWDWDSCDASGNCKPADYIYENSIKGADADDHHIILLMHDAPAKTTTADALPRIIQYYKDKGYRFDVLSENSYTYQHNPNN